MSLSTATRTPLSLIALSTLGTVALGQGADDCAMAQPIAGTAPFAFDTTGATTDGLPDLLCDNAGSDQLFDDVWFSWSAQETAPHIVSLCGSTGDTRVAVYAGACGSAPIACNDDACALQSELTFDATDGQLYLIRIGNFLTGGGSNGTFSIRPDRPLLNPANGHFYRVFTETLSWDAASAAATASLWQGAPGHLVTINDQAELDWILQNLAPSRPWIGLSQNLSSPSYSEPGGGWEWVTGEPVTFTNWAPGEPNDTSASGGSENYAELFASGVWNDAELNHAPTSQYLVEWDGNGLGTNYCDAAANSTGATGTISASGSLFVSDADFVLTASDLPQVSFGFFIVSTIQGFVPNPGGSAGNLCLAGSIGRFVGPGQIQNSGTGGEFSLTVNLSQIPTPTGFVQVVPNETWNFQAWHRDSAMGAPTSNFTNGLEAMFR
ncbi:MAG: lectin-like protein [Planctomycetota bacterium]